MVGGVPRALTLNFERGGDSVDMQHIEFGDGSAMSAALAEAFDYFQRIADDFDLADLRAAAVGSMTVLFQRVWPPNLPPPVPRGQRMSRIVIQRAVKARGRLYRSPARRVL